MAPLCPYILPPLLTFLGMLGSCLSPVPPHSFPTLSPFIAQ